MNYIKALFWSSLIMIVYGVVVYWYTPGLMNAFLNNSGHNNFVAGVTGAVLFTIGSCGMISTAILLHMEGKFSFSGMREDDKTLIRMGIYGSLLSGLGYYLCEYTDETGFGILATLVGMFILVTPVCYLGLWIVMGKAWRKL